MDATKDFLLTSLKKDLESGHEIFLYSHALQYNFLPFWVNTQDTNLLDKRVHDSH